MADPQRPGVLREVPPIAQRTITVLTDDVYGDGTPATQNIPFALDRTSYLIDLDDAHADKMREQLSTWTFHARRLGGAGAGAGAAAGSGGTAAVRAWAKEHGHPVSDRGRIKADVHSAYEAA